MSLTERDMKVIDFINLVGTCRSEHIRKLFFKECTNTVWDRRARKLDDYGELKRYRSALFDREYIYYSDKKTHNKLLRHDMYITDLVTKLIDKNIEIVQLKRNVQIGNLISDAFLIIRYKDGNRIIRRSYLVEVQLSGRINDCVEKYKDIDNIESIRNYILGENLQVMPRLIVISNLEGKVKCELKSIKISCCLDSIEDIFNI